jgi:UDP-2-acetamido-2,6-beta-L-arabino-hexul-4-ose reductase
MSQIAITGANGFLGWHTRSAIAASGARPNLIAVGESFDLDSATAALTGAERLIHIAGVNRGTDEEVAELNIHFADQVAEAIVRSDSPPSVIAFANSTQSLDGGVYGEAKSRAADVLAQASSRVGAKFENVILPNLFGEHGRPFYNAVTSTFAHLIAEGGTPEIPSDRELRLLHAQDAADALLGAADDATAVLLTVSESVSGLAHRLESIAAVYRIGEIPDISQKFDRDLFNTYRSYVFASRTPIALSRHSDSRGSFFEIVRSHGGQGQSSFSTTAPGITRGEHFHRRKVERFTVLSGSATISLRRLFSGEVIEFRVTGENPTAIDMPTMWAHNIMNTGSDLLYTSFWSNEIFDPTEPDTVAEAVLA